MRGLPLFADRRRMRLLAGGLAAIAGALAGLAFGRQRTPPTVEGPTAVVLGLPAAASRVDSKGEPRSGAQRVTSGSVLATALPAGVLPPPDYAPRDADEWQGMRVNMALAPPCERAEHCGLAMACLAGRCGPCRSDGECAPGEVCAVQHCVTKAHADCRSRRDCAHDDGWCVLSGYSADARGNGDLQATCKPDVGGSMQSRDELAESETFTHMPLAVVPQDLLDSLTVSGLLP